MQNIEVMNNVVTYITQMSGDIVELQRVKKAEMKSLPLFIVDGFRLYRTTIFNVEVLLLRSKSEDSYPPSQLHRIMELCESKLSLPSVFILDSITSYNRQRLAARRVNYIIPLKQMFIPSLMLDIKKEVTKVAPREATMTATAQLIVLYHLQKGSLNGKTSREISELIGLTYISTTRAVAALYELSVISFSGGKERSVIFKAEGRDLWSLVEPMLLSPIEKVIFTDDRIEGIEVSETHINGLAHYTMISRDRGEEYATTKSETKRLRVGIDSESGDNRVEIWRYNPRTLSQNGVVDKLSLYLSLREDADNRVQIELENLMNSIKW